MLGSGFWVLALPAEAFFDILKLCEGGSEGWVLGKVQGARCKVQGQSSMFQVPGSKFDIRCSKFSVTGTGCWVLGSGFGFRNVNGLSIK